MMTTRDIKAGVSVKQHWKQSKIGIFSSFDNYEAVRLSLVSWTKISEHLAAATTTDVLLNKYFRIQALTLVREN